MKRLGKLLLSITMTAMVLTSVPAVALAVSEQTGLISTISYTDVHGGWFEAWTTKYGYPDIFSSSDGCFHPDTSITRMEFARMLHKALDININYFAPTDIGDFFDDVKDSDAGAGALYDLAVCGIVDVQGSFRPTQALARGDMIHFIMNAFYYFVGSDYALPDIALPPFADDAEIGDAFRADVNRSAVLGLVNGRDNQMVCTTAEATRAEAVTVAGRLAELLENYRSNVLVKASAKESDGALHLTLSILNNTENTVTINHLNGQYFDFVILDKGGAELYRWSDDMYFTDALTSVEISPGEEKVYSTTVDKETYVLIKDKVETIKAYITGTSDDFSIEPGGYFVAL
ncbi:hypothetical protein SDC9_49809 [bioreactor metagenome]|uniref:SLH domain-containing protein n=1 Tax=bioreactor metagenome TaxID=1076179 RepID=A0A644WIF1_9ZZZZ